MGKQREKYLATLTPKQIKRINQVLKKIRAGTIEGLDILAIEGKKNTRRCRVGGLRIVFKKEKNKNTILKILPRGDIYKN